MKETYFEEAVAKNVGSSWSCS